MVRYETTASERFETDFPQLSYRLKNLEDRMIAYFLRGDPDCLISCDFCPSAEPHFVGVRFDEAEATRYEEYMREFFAKHRGRQNAALPRPRFPVEIDVSFGEFCETFGFSFASYSEETLLDFCGKVRDRAVYLFRHRFACRPQ